MRALLTVCVLCAVLGVVGAPALAYDQRLDGTCTLLLSDPLKARVILRSIITDATTRGDMETLSTVNHHCGDYDWKYTDVVFPDFAFELLPIFRDAGAYRLLAYVYDNIANKYLCIPDQAENAYRYFKLALESALKADDKDQIAKIQLELASPERITPDPAAYRSSVERAILTNAGPVLGPLVITARNAEGGENPHNSASVAAWEQVMTTALPLAGTPEASWVTRYYLRTLGGTYLASPALIAATCRLVEEEYQDTGYFVPTQYIQFFLNTCSVLWTGKDDAYRAALYRMLRYADRSGVRYHAIFADKLQRYGRLAEAQQYRQQALAYVLRSPGCRAQADLFYLLTPDTSRTQRQQILARSCQAFTFPYDPWHNAMYQGDLSNYAPSYVYSHIQSSLERGDKVEAIARKLEFGQLFLANAPQFPAREDQISGLLFARCLFDDIGRQDLVAAVKGQLEALTKGDPTVMLRYALAPAQSARAKNDWPAVTEHLAPLLTTLPAEATAQDVEAILLLEQAYRASGKIADAETLITRAQGCLQHNALPASQRIETALTLADRTTDKSLKTSLLVAARQTAAASQLALYNDRIAEQLDLLALEAGDAATQLQALLDLARRREAQRAHLAFNPNERQRWFANNLWVYRKLLRLSATAQNVKYAFTVAEYMRARSLLDELAWRKVELGAAVPPALSAKLAALSAERTATLALLDAPASPTVPGAPAALAAQLATLAQREAALETAVRDAVPAFRIASASTTIDPQQLWTTISNDPTRAVLQYTLVDDGVVVVAFHGAMPPKVVFLPITGDALWEQVGRFREQIWTRDPKVEESAAALYSLLLKPVEPFFTDAAALWIVADGALQVLPFAALRNGQGEYLAARVPTAMAPSISLLCTPRPKTAPLTKTVIVAAPDTGATPTGIDDPRGLYIPIRGMYIPIRGLYIPIRGDDGVDTTLTTLASIALPGAKAEGEALARTLPHALLLTGKAATKARLRQEGATARVVHIATHSYADPEEPNHSGLLLAGTGTQKYSTLTAQEVYAWRLQARLVTLSACQTALGKNVAGEGVLGLSRAFLCAGADTVVCTLWPVADSSTATLMTNFYAALDAGCPVETALAEAQRLFLAKDATREPYFWAGFTVVRGTWKD